MSHDPHLDATYKAVSEAAQASIETLTKSGFTLKGVATLLLSTLAVLHHQAPASLRQKIQDDLRKLLVAMYSDPPCSTCQVVGETDVQKSYVQNKTTGR